MNILLINPKVHDKNIIPKFPLGLGYIAAVLKNAHHYVRVIDLNASFQSCGEITNELSLTRYDLVGLTGFITQYKEVKDIASIIKKKFDAVVVLGGGLASAVPDFILQETEVDITVIGEGEVTILDIIKNLEEGKGFNSVDGIAYKNSGDIVKTSPRPLIRDISSLPFPAWDLFPMEYYLNTPTSGFLPLPQISIISSRGCPHHCTYCFHGIFGHEYRARTPDSMIEEIQLLQINYGVRGIMFEDDVFPLDKKRVHEFCDKLIENRINILWSCTGRVNHVDRELLRKMKEAGCVSVSYGIESGSQEMINRIKKGITVVQAKKAIELTWEVGLIPHGFMMIGIHGETVESIQKSVKFCQDTGLLAEFSIATPIPSTALYQHALNTGKIGTVKELMGDWSRWTEDLIINMSDIPDAQLVHLKKKAEKDILNFLVMKHKKLILRMFYVHIRIHGLFTIVGRLFRAIRLFLRVNTRRGVSGIKPLSQKTIAR